MAFTKSMVFFIFVTGFLASQSIQTPLQAQSLSSSYKFLKAVKKLDYRKIKVAVEKGVNVNTRDYDDNSTALVMAARKKAPQLIQYLLANGAKTDLVGRDGRSPLLISAAGGDKAAVTLLLQSGADPDLADNNGTTPLMAATLARQRVIVSLLLESGADHTLEDYSGRSALQHAIDKRQRKIENMLRNAGATR